MTDESFSLYLIFHTGHLHIVTHLFLFLNSCVLITGKYIMTLITPDVKLSHLHKRYLINHT